MKKFILAAFVASMVVSPLVYAKEEITKQTKVFYSKGRLDIIKPTGRDGKYPVFAQISNADLDDFRYNIDSSMYDVDQLMKVLPSIHPEDVGKGGIRCEFLCVNAKGQVIGWNPYRR
jgi:hypothetical protein